MLRDLLQKPQKVAPGHRTCRGCQICNVARHVLRATNDPCVVACATSCLEVTTTIYPYTSWNIPWIHSTFGATGALISGIESAYKVLKRKGRMKNKVKFVAFAGDGGSYDIGLQSLSGMLERGHDCVYICYDNEAYQNTGNQRSAATPYGASTTTTPEGKLHHGKEQFRKNLTKIAIAHDIPYVAQTTIAHWQDLYHKAKKAFQIKGPCFINVLCPCVIGWGIPSYLSIKICDLAVRTNFWPLYEVENGKYTLNLEPRKPLPISFFLKPQARFKHLFKKENKKIIVRIQKHVDEEWKRLKEKCK